MCGIAGTINLGDKPFKEYAVKKMVSSLKHRGPDGEGFYRDAFVHMGMRRLSIIDVSGGDQPLYNEDKSIVIMGNGEIYNYVELGNLLRKKHKFRTKSDIEIAAHAYEEWGMDFVHKLRGMYVLALYDKKKNLFFLLRDRLGEKPCYYSFNKNGFLFSSELKGLLNSNQVNKEINLAAVDSFLHYYYIPEPKTLFKNIKKLPGGSYIEINLESKAHRMKKYWDGRNIEIDNFDKDPTAKIREIFAESCKLTLRSDVPVGISLSGGIDSGAILSFAAPYYKDNMKAFSIGYKGNPESDEREMAKALAKRYGVEFIGVEIDSKNLVKEFPNLVYMSDDPVADIAAYSIYMVHKAAREEGVKVLLGGLGGDEIFWGYPVSINAVKKNISNLGSGLNSFYYDNPNPENSHEKINSYYTANMALAYKDNYLSFLENPYLYTEKEIAKHYLNLLRELLLSSYGISLNDRLSMASSVELRSPFLDYKLVEYALSSNEVVMSFNKAKTKYWLKKAMKGILPNKVLARPKRGFTPPVGEWIKDIVLDYFYLLFNGALVKCGIINRVSVFKMLNPLNSANYYLVYQFILLEIWLRIYFYDEKVEDIKPKKFLT